MPFRLEGPLPNYHLINMRFNFDENSATEGTTDHAMFFRLLYGNVVVQILSLNSILLGSQAPVGYFPIHHIHIDGVICFSPYIHQT